MLPCWTSLTLVFARLVLVFSLCFPLQLSLARLQGGAQARGLKGVKREALQLRGSACMAAAAADTDSEDAAVQRLANLSSPNSTDDGHEHDTDRYQHEGAGDASGGATGTGGIGEAPRVSGAGEGEHVGGGAPGSLQDRKRRRLAEQHNKSEQRRRRKINTKLEELQAMVPFSRSREKAAILLDVIDYIKSVQAQLHIMSAITACDYAAYRPSPPHTPHDPYFPASLGGYTSLGGISPTSIMPLPTFHSFPMNSGEALPLAGMYPGAPGGSMGFQPGSSGSGGGGGERGRGDAGGAAAGEGGWSFSSGESSAALTGAAGDNTASSYEPVMY